MNIDLRHVQEHEWETLHNLWEKYDYETSWYDKCDVNDLGLYDNDDFNFYINKDDKWAYFIIVNTKIAGFILITNFSVVDNIKVDYQISEFFVMKKYSRLGIGKYIFNKILALYKGIIQVVCHPQNIIAVNFWTKTINEYTNGNYEMISSAPDFYYSNSVAGNVFVFKN